jgi:hypothetical protein
MGVRWITKAFGGATERLPLAVTSGSFDTDDPAGSRGAALVQYPIVAVQAAFEHKE